mmetsp:Transcript_42072/g.50501  ORF Transcript_42072/g.50501 Transcript_42072/m.50501 type:complete len:137 (+) Transcript_42072:32-442(+)
MIPRLKAILPANPPGLVVHSNNVSSPLIRGEQQFEVCVPSIGMISLVFLLLTPRPIMRLATKLSQPICFEPIRPPKTARKLFLVLVGRKRESGVFLRFVFFIPSTPFMTPETHTEKNAVDLPTIREKHRSIGGKAV